MPAGSVRDMLNTGPGAYTLGTVSIPRLGSVGLKLMPKPSPSLYVSAVLIWLPGGDEPRNDPAGSWLQRSAWE